MENKKLTEHPWPITKIETIKVKNVLISYSDHLDDKGHISIINWQNGEGFDLTVNCGVGGHGSSGRIELTWSQWNCLKKGIKELHKYEG